MSKPYCTVTALITFISLFSSKKMKVLVLENCLRTKFSRSERIFFSSHKKLDSENILSFTESSPITVVIKVIHYFLSEATNAFNLFFWENLDCLSKLLRFEIKNVPEHSSTQSLDALNSKGIHYVFLASTSWIIKPLLLNDLDPKIINIHPGRLPQHRSLDSIPWSILSREPLFITSHFVDSGIDTGPIILRQPVFSFRNDSLSFITLRCNWMKPFHFLNIIGLLESKSIEATPQNLVDGEHHTPMDYEQLREINQILSDKFDSEHYSYPFII